MGVPSGKAYQNFISFIAHMIGSVKCLNLLVNIISEKSHLVMTAPFELYRFLD